MPDKVIMAYFHAPDEAEGIASKLRALRVEDVKIMRLEGFPDAHAYEGMNPLTGFVTGMSGLTMDASPSSPDAAVLLAADPAASGLSVAPENDYFDGRTRNIALTAVVDEAMADKVCRLIEQAGGLI